MTRAKEKRVEKILEVREKQLDVRVKELADARAREEQRKLELLAAEKKTIEAVGEREGLAAAEATPPTWKATEEWLSDMRDFEALAAVARATAAEETVAAQLEVREAHANVKRMEALRDILRAQRAAKEAKAERKMEDELAGRNSNRTR